MPTNIIFSAGEPSGDRYAAELAAHLQNHPLSGIGGKKSLAANINLIADSSHWGAVSITESLKVVPRVYKGLLAAKKHLRQAPKNSLFIPIDYGFINIRLAKYAKSLGHQVLYFIPPGSWRKTKQGQDLPAITDHIVTPFPWSAEILNQMGATAHFFGHPLKQMVAQSPDPATPRHGIAILPGSRMHELTHNLPVIAQTLAQLPSPPQITAALAPNITPEVLKSHWAKHSQLPIQTSTNTYQILKSSQAAIICSGTATLEAALCHCPTVVMYRGSKLMELEAKILKPKIEFIALPNILLNRLLVPELIQWDATPEKIITHLTPLLDPTSPEHQAQIQGFQTLQSTLGPADCIDKTITLINKITKI